MSTEFKFTDLMGAFWPLGLIFGGAKAAYDVGRFIHDRQKVEEMKNLLDENGLGDIKSAQEAYVRGTITLDQLVMIKSILDQF